MMGTKKKIITIIIGVEVVIIAAVLIFLFYINSDSVKVNRQLELAQRYLLEEDYEQAIAAFGVVIDIDPKNEDAYLGMAEAYAAADDLENAVKVLEKASRRIDSEEVLAQLEIHTAEIGQRKQASEAAQRAAEAAAVSSIDQAVNAPQQDTEAAGSVQGNALGESPANDTDDLLSNERIQSLEKKSLSEGELLTITQTTAGHQLEDYVYVDMDYDGSKELIGVYSDNMDLYQTWYCSSDGETCLLIHQNNEGMDACEIELLDFNNEIHVVINAYCMMGTRKNYTIIALGEKGISCLASNKYGYVCMRENGDITLDIEAYDGMYDPNIGGTIGHTWKDTYLYFDGVTYKEYGATEITETEYLSYKNAQNMKDMIARELGQSDTTKLEYSYFIRKNNIIHIQCNVYSSDGTIQYGYYTVRFSGDVLDEQLGEYTWGQMEPSFSDWELK